ncbi:hypothetical protein K7X08_010925 [Anisodus acutangulus]|uniref:Uncharacterized protein n=1 Tax=Anisodus acutangulus TaxID=402998 RepID=A0A9Q1RA89_9SOLA|nr:hypothetical protein K7X08_010925 [Anisodus acutangulus]
MVEFARALTWELFGNFASEREKWRGIGEAMVHGRVNDWAQRSSSDGKVQYLLVLDTLNFYFLLDKEMSYDHLASGSKVTLESGKFAFDVDRLQIYTVLLLLMFQILKVQIVTLDRI